MIDQFAKDNGLDQSTFLKQLLRKGIDEYKFNKAINEYRQGKISLSRAAEISGLNIRYIISRLPEMNVELNYNIDDLSHDI
jgi:predicted HTH domain antitoxin